MKSTICDRVLRVFFDALGGIVMGITAFCVIGAIVLNEGSMRYIMPAIVFFIGCFIFWLIPDKGKRKGK